MPLQLHEATIGFEWMLTVLSVDPTLAGYAPGGVHRSFAPIGTITPYVILGFMAGVDSVTMNGFRMLNDTIYQAKAVGPTADQGSLAVSNAAAQLDTLIGSPPTAGAVPGGVVLASYRRSILYLDELVNGELWTNQGGLYRLIIEHM